MSRLIGPLSVTNSSRIGTPLAGNARERRLLLDRAAACAWQAAR